MSSPGYRPSLILIILFIAVSQIGAVMHTPSIPAMGRAFDVPVLSIQLTMTSYLTGFAVAQILVGTLSDAVGRRPVLLGGLVVYTLASLGCALAPSIEVMIGLRLVQAAGACTGLVVARAIIRDSFDASQMTRYMGYLGMAIGLMPLLSPSLGGFLQGAIGWYANFFAMATVGIAAVAACLVSLRETLPRESRREGGLRALLGGFPILLRQPSFLGYTSAMGISTAVFFVYLTVGPLVLQGIYGVSPETYGFVAMTMPAGYITGNFLSSRISTRIGVARGTILGYCGMLFGGALLLVLAPTVTFSLPVFVAPMLVIGLGAGFVTSCGYAGVVQGDPSLAGTASGLSGMLQMAMTALATLAVGMLDEITLMSYGWLQTSLTALGLAMFVLLAVMWRSPAASEAG